MNRRDLKTESPIEDVFVNLIAERFHAGVQLKSQVPMRGRYANYRADFVASYGSFKAVIECDGREFHEYRRDEVRDLDMLAGCDIDMVIRLPGCDLVYGPDLLLPQIEMMAPYLFDPERYPLGGGDMSINSYLLSGRPVKPIFRARVPFAGVETAKRWTDAPCFIVYGMGPGRQKFIVKAQCPWSRRHSQDLHRIVSVGNFIQEDVQDLIRRDPDYEDLVQFFREQFEANDAAKEENDGTATF